MPEFSRTIIESSNDCPLTALFQLEKIQSYSVLIPYKKGNQIYTASELVTGVYYLKKGCVKLYTVSSYGHEVIYSVATAGSILNYRCLTTEQAFQTQSACCKSDSEVYYIPLSIFKNTLLPMPEFASALTQLACSDVNFLEERIYTLHTKQVKERIAVTLLYLQKKCGKDANGYISIDWKREEIASLSATTVESVIRHFSDLKKKQIIDTHQKKIRLLNINELYKMAKQSLF